MIDGVTSCLRDMNHKKPSRRHCLPFAQPPREIMGGICQFVSDIIKQQFASVRKTRSYRSIRIPLPQVDNELTTVWLSYRNDFKTDKPQQHQLGEYQL